MGCIVAQIIIFVLLSAFIQSLLPCAERPAHARCRGPARGRTVAAHRSGHIRLDGGDPDLPVFIAHGEWDGVVMPQLGREAFASLGEQGLRPVWHSYPMEHQVCIEELRDLGHWLRARVGLE